MFHKVVRQHVQGVVQPSDCKFTGESSSEKIHKSVKFWQNYGHKFVASLFGPSCKRFYYAIVKFIRISFFRHFKCLSLFLFFAFSANLLVGRQEGHLACKKTEWWGAGVVICLERCADLHMVQLMPLPLTISCSSKVQIGFVPFWYRLTRVVPGKEPLNGRVCVCVRVFKCLSPVCFRLRHALSFQCSFSCCLLLPHGRWRDGCDAVSSSIHCFATTPTPEITTFNLRIYPLRVSEWVRGFV